MNKHNSTGFKISLVLSFALGLTACGSDDNGNSLNDWTIDQETKKSQAQIMFINTLDQMATFYAKTNQMDRNVFDSRQQVNSVLVGVAEDHTFEWNKGSFEDSKLGVADTNSLTHQATIDIELEDSKTYWAVAWIDNGDYQLSAFNKAPLSTNGAYNVRIFTTLDLDVTNNDENAPATTIQKGKISTPFNIKNCATSLTVGDTDIDICTVARPGQAYLVVVDDQGQLFVGQE